MSKSTQESEFKLSFKIDPFALRIANWAQTARIILDEQTLKIRTTVQRYSSSSKITTADTAKLLELLWEASRSNLTVSERLNMLAKHVTGDLIDLIVERRRIFPIRNPKR